MQHSVNTLAPRRLRRRRVIVAGVVLALGTTLALAAWTFRRLSDPTRLREVAWAAFQPVFNGVVSVSEAQFTLPGTLTVRNVVVRADRPTQDHASSDDHEASSVSGGNAPLETIRCPEIVMRFHPWNLIVGQWNLASIAIRRAEITFRPDDAEPRNAFAAIFRAPKADAVVSAKEAPSIEVDNARVRLDVGGPSSPMEWAFTVRGLPAPSDPLTLDLTWNTGAEGSSGRMQVDLRNRRLRNLGGATPAVPINTLTRLVSEAGHPLQAQLDRFQLRGTVRLTDFDVQFDGETGNDSLAVEIADGSAMFPIGDSLRAETHDAASPRDTDDEADLDDSAESAEFATFTEALGRVNLHENQIFVAASAKLRGAEVALGGHFTFDGDAKDPLGSSTGAIHAEAKGFRLPRVENDAPAAERRFVRGWPMLRSIYHDYDPHGVVDLDLRLHKTAGQPFRIERGLVTIVDADASFRLRPYRGANIHGSIEFNSDEIIIRDLTGQHDDGTVVVNGRVMGTDRCAACEIQVRATDLPIDEALYGAMPKTFVAAVRDFQTVGRIGVELAAKRSGCNSDRPREWTSQTTIHLGGIAAEYVRFPYPLTDLRGTLAFAEGRLRFESITGRHGEGKIAATGAIEVADSSVSALELTIDGSDLAFDDGIMNALPAGSRESWSAFQLGGGLGVRARIFRDSGTGSIQHESEIDVRSATLQHTLLPLPFSEIKGRVRLSGDRIETEALRARCGDAEVSGAGWASLSGDAGSWRFESPDFLLNDATVAALPPAWRQRLTSWRFDGPVAIAVRAERNALTPGAPWSMDLSATFADSVVRHTGLPSPFEDVRGTIQVNGAGTRSAGLDARLDTARLHAAFDASPAEQGERGFLSLSAVGLQLGPWIGGALPDRLRSAWTSADATGRVDLHIDRLDFNSVGDADRGTWSVDGRIDLHDVTLRGTPTLERLNGRIAGFGFLVDRMGGCTLNGDLALDSFGFLGRDVTALHAAWSLLQSRDGTTNFGLDRIQGKVYGGTLTGQVEAVADDAGTRYTLSATAQDVEINPWLNAGRRASQLDPIPSDIRGEADAQLYFSGSVGDTDSQRGGGMVEIHDARLYKLPILLAILSVLNVSMPEQQAFDEAQASFYILGNRMRFNEIALRGPPVALLGNGVMTFPGQGLDLDLFSVNPRQWARVPGVSDVLEGTTRQLVGIKVTGSLRSPVVRLKPLQGITEEFRRLFQKRKPVPLRPATG